MPLAHRRICGLCGSAFALVKPPDEDEKELALWNDGDSDLFAALANQFRLLFRCRQVPAETSSPASRGAPELSPTAPRLWRAAVPFR